MLICNYNKLSARILKLATFSETGPGGRMNGLETTFSNQMNKYILK